MDAFDEHMRQLAAGYTKAPGPTVWAGIEAALERRKRRRVLAWWLLPLLLTSAGLWLYLQPDQPTQPTTTAEPAQVTLPTAEPQQGAAATPEVAAVPLSTPAQVARKKQSMKGTTAPQYSTLPEKIHFISHSLVPGRAPQIVQATAATTGSNTPTAIDSTDTAPSLAKPALPLHPALSTPTQANAVAASSATPHPEADNTTKAANTTLPDTIQKASEPLAAITQAYPTADSPAVQLPKADHQRQAEWQLIAGIGLHNLSGGKLLQWAQSDAAFNAGLPMGNTTVGGAGTQLQPTRPGGGLILGLERRQFFAKSSTVGWTAGLLYQYQRIRQQSGLQVPDTGGLATLERINAPYLYAPGSSLSSTGWQHRVHLSAGMHWQYKRWQLAGKLYGGTVLAHRYLLPLSRQSGWAPSGSTAARGYAGIEASVGIRIGRIYTSFAAQQNLTPASRYRFLPRQYWRSMELRASIPIQFSKPHQ